MAEQKKTLLEWMNERGLSSGQLAQAAGLDPRVVEAIAQVRYTSSPRQRQRLAQALGVAAEEIWFGHAVQVDHMYGHGPQFGRSP